MKIKRGSYIHIISCVVIIVIISAVTCLANNTDKDNQITKKDSTSYFKLTSEETLVFSGKVNNKTKLIITRNKNGYFYNHKLYLIKTTLYGSKILLKKEIYGQEKEVDIKFGNLTSSKYKNLFIFIEGQATTAYMFKVLPRSLVAQYERTQGRAREFCQDGDGIFEILVCNTYHHFISEGDIPDKIFDRSCKQIEGHPYLKVVCKLHNSKYRYSYILPDLDSEKEIPKEHWFKFVPKCDKKGNLVVDFGN